MKFRTLALAAALAFGGAAMAAPNDTTKIRGGSELSQPVKVNRWARDNRWEKVSPTAKELP